MSKKTKAKRNNQWVDVDPQIVSWRKRKEKTPEAEKADFDARRQAIKDLRQALKDGLETDEQD